MNLGRVEGLVLAVLGAAYWRGAYLVPPFGVSDPIGPTGFPALLGVALVVVGASLTVRPGPRREGRAARLIHVAAVFGLLVVYMLLFERAGFTVSTALFLSASIALFAPRWGWRIPLVALALTAMLYLLFAVGMGVLLPPGPLGIP